MSKISDKLAKSSNNLQHSNIAIGGTKSGGACYNQNRNNMVENQSGITNEVVGELNILKQDVQRLEKENRNLKAITANMRKDGHVVLC